MSDHELDRRLNDQNFKLEVTRQLTEVTIELKQNTAKTESIQSHIAEIDRLLKGTGRLDEGLVGQTLDNVIAIEKLQSFLKKGFWVILIIVVLFADQLSPLIRDWLYQKTHLAIFHSVYQDFKDKKSTVIVKHYHNTFINPPAEPDK